jgi:hypothetical protein
MGSIPPPYRILLQNYLANQNDDDNDDDDDDAPPPPPRPLRRTLNIQQEEEIVDNFNNNRDVQPFAGNIRSYFANIEEFQNSLIYRFLTPAARVRADDWFNMQHGGKRRKSKSKKIRKQSKKRFSKKSRKYRK